MLKPRAQARHADNQSYDTGTLWLMRRHHRVARCALLALHGEWEVRVLVDGQPVLTNRCEQTTDVFALADEWKGRMANRGWALVTPTALHEPVA
jgi:hypothetical protein